MTDQIRPYLEIVKVDGKAVGTRNPDTGVYTPAVRCAPPGQPVGRLPMPLDRGHWGDWP
jgi:hypothetical protein